MSMVRDHYKGADRPVGRQQAQAAGLAGILTSTSLNIDVICGHNRICYPQPINSLSEISNCCNLWH